MERIFMATYNGLHFNTELEAIWAAFFDLAKWKWWYNPVTIDNWQADFKVEFECSHSECNGSHTLLVSVVSLRDTSSLNAHPSLEHRYGVSKNNVYIADAGALFGTNPHATKWEMSHGAGGGIEQVINWVDNANELWDIACTTIIDSNLKR